eukprot:jgi/Ulvmu1/2417/UM133_0018.1
MSERKLREGTAYAPAGGRPVQHSSGSMLPACVWTGDCDRPGCVNKCITNIDLTQSWYVLFDRSTGENFYSGCPTLANWVNRALSITRGTGRRLLSQNDAVDIIKATRMGRSSVESATARGRAASRSLLNLLTPFGSDGESSAPAPSIATGGGFSSDLPSNVCPTPVDVEEAAQGIGIFASLFRQVFDVDASGDPIPSDLEDIAYILEQPNTYQWLATWLDDPDRVAAYLSNNCASETIAVPQAYEYLNWLDPDDQEGLDTNLTMVQCVDNFGAYEQFAKDYQSALLACNPPFDLNPDCFTGFGHYIVTSSACATAYARMWNVTDPTPLVSVSANVNAIQDACSDVTNEADCLSASTPVLDTIVDLHNDIPVRSPLEFAPTTPVEPIAPTAVVCVGDDCADPAEEPVVAPPDVGVTAAPRGIEPLTPNVATPEAPAPPVQDPEDDTEDVEETPDEAEGADEGSQGDFDPNEPAVTELSASGELARAVSAVAAVAVLLPMFVM